MTRLKSCVALAAILAAGCASAPEQAASNAAASIGPQGTPVQAAEPATVAAPTDPTGATATPAAEATTASVAVVEANELTQDPGTIVRCRDVLIQGSNVIVMRCMTRDDWKKFEYYQMIEAQETLREMREGGRETSRPR